MEDETMMVIPSVYLCSISGTSMYSYVKDGSFVDTCSVNVLTV